MERKVFKFKKYCWQERKVGSDVDHEDTELPEKPVVNHRGQERALKWYDHLQLGNAIHMMASKRNSAPWDITIPVKYVVYSIMSYAAMEYIPRLFLLLNIWAQFSCDMQFLVIVEQTTLFNYFVLHTDCYEP